MCGIQLETKKMCKIRRINTYSESQMRMYIWTDTSVGVFGFTSSIHACVPLASQLRVECLIPFLALEWTTWGEKRMMGNCHGCGTWALVWVQAMTAAGRSSSHNGSLLMRTVFMTCEQPTCQKCYKRLYLMEPLRGHGDENKQLGGKYMIFV